MNLSGLLTERGTLLALMEIRCFWPHNTIGRTGLVIHQAWKLRSFDEPSGFTSHSIIPDAEKQCGTVQEAAYVSFRVSNTQAIRAVFGEGDDCTIKAAPGN